MVRAAAETATAVTGEARLGRLPEWDLSDLYPGRDSPELARDLAELGTQATAFRARYERRLAALTGAELAAAVRQYEKQQEVAGRIMSYASLVHAGDLSDPQIGRFSQTMQERTKAKFSIDTRYLEARNHSQSIRNAGSTRTPYIVLRDHKNGRGGVRQLLRSLGN